MRPQIGDDVVVHPVLSPPGDPYIFQFQHSGQITSAVPSGFMIKLHSAVGEWGPVPPSRLMSPEEWAARTLTAWKCSKCRRTIRQNASPNDQRRACEHCVMAPPAITWVEQYEKR